MCKKNFLQLFCAVIPMMGFAELPKSEPSLNNIQNQLEELEANRSKSCERCPRGPRGRRGPAGATGATGATGETGVVEAVSYIYATLVDSFIAPPSAPLLYNVNNSSRNFTLNSDGSITYVAAETHLFNIQVNIYSSTFGASFGILKNGILVPGGNKLAASSTQTVISGQVTESLNPGDIITIIPLQATVLVAVGQGSLMRASITINQID